MIKNINDIKIGRVYELKINNVEDTPMYEAIKKIDEEFSIPQEFILFSVYAPLGLSKDSEEDEKGIFVRKFFVGYIEDQYEEENLQAIDEALHELGIPSFDTYVFSTYEETEVEEAIENEYWLITEGNF